MSRHPDPLDPRRRTLEDAFFIKEDRKLIAKLQQLRKMEETKKKLSEASGITNDEILQKLVDLNIQAETVASLAVVPLVEVAWADRVVDDDEKRAILSAADLSGMARGSIDFVLLEQWLTHRPSPELLNSWTHYIQALCGKLTRDERRSLRDELLGKARAVAEATGGFLGFGNRISEAEERMLKKLESVFKM